MGNDISRGKTFLDGGTYGGADLNALADEATIKKTFLSTKSSKSVLVGADSILVGDSEDTDNYKKIAVSAINTFVQKNFSRYAVDTGATNAYAVAPSPAYTGYATGMEIVFKATNENTAASTIDVNSIGAKNIFLNGLALAGGEIVTNGFYRLVYDGTQFQITESYAASHINNGIADGRLTLTSGTPVTIGDVTAATAIYYTPYKGNKIALYNGTFWQLFKFSELTLSLSALTADKNYDVFVYNNSGTLTLESLIWTNDSTRATALVRQDGVLIKSGATSRRYLGTFRTTGTTGQTEDSNANRFLFDGVTPILRTLYKTEATASWTYATATWRPWNNSVANRVSFVVGQDAYVNVYCVTSFGSATHKGYVAFAVDSTTTPTSATFVGSDVLDTKTCLNKSTTSAGYHYLQVLEQAPDAATTNFTGGDIVGEIRPYA